MTNFFKRGRSAWLAVASAVVATAALGTDANASYVLTPRQSGTGATSASVAPGGSVAVNFVLTRSGSDAHTSAIFQTNFSAPGLIEQSYLWASPYPTGDVSGGQAGNDDSTPNAGAVSGRAQTPATISATTYAGPAGVVDVNFSNLVTSGTFTEGTLVTMNLQVPANWTGPSAVTLSVVPDEFASGFTVIPTTSGGTFTVNVVPEPGTAGLLGATVVGLLTARRRRAAR